MRRSERSKERDDLMIWVMHLHTPASALSSGLVPGKAPSLPPPPFGGAVAAESQLEALISQ